MSETQVQRLLAKYDRAVPRYTSYPPANHFHEGVGAREYLDALAGIPGGEAVALYVHIPFCERRCIYCGCHVVPTRKKAAGEEYLERLEQEIALVRGAAREPLRAASVHLGGGTPTYLSPAQLERLLGACREAFLLESGAEVAVELDPRVTTAEHLDALARCGATRVSLGVQDTSEEVQQAIGRFQGRDLTVRFFELCRSKGFRSINVDLVYGLPLQTRERFLGTLRDVLALRPERLAVFGYAHVPWVRPNQKAIDPATLPTGPERVELCALAHEELTRGGYEHIGLDHFALPGDELALAREEGRLGRNFMGYTPFKGIKVVGFGVSAISDLGSGYFQVEKKLSDYYRALDRGEAPIERGLLLTEDDAVRRHVIQEVLCTLRLDTAEFEARFGEPFAERFAREIDGLRPLQADGLVRVTPRAIDVLPLGRLLLRNVAAVFDAYLQKAPPEAPTYSRAV